MHDWDQQHRDVLQVDFPSTAQMRNKKSKDKRTYIIQQTRAGIAFDDGLLEQYT